jgi:hypothetical protein
METIDKLKIVKQSAQVSIELGEVTNGDFTFEDDKIKIELEYYDIAEDSKELIYERWEEVSNNNNDLIYDLKIYIKVLKIIKRNYVIFSRKKTIFEYVKVVDISWGCFNIFKEGNWIEYIKNLYLKASEKLKREIKELNKTDFEPINDEEIFKERNK